MRKAWLVHLAVSQSERMTKPKEGASHQNGQAHDKGIVRANGHDKGDDRRPFSIKCEWDIKQTQQFSDDGTNTYFWWAKRPVILEKSP